MSGRRRFCRVRSIKRRTTKFNIYATIGVFSVDRWFFKWYDDYVCCAASIGEFCALDTVKGRMDLCMKLLPTLIDE